MNTAIAPRNTPSAVIGATNTRDFAGADSFSIQKLERLLRDCEEQPLWRFEADVCCAYVDGTQLSPDQQAWCRANEIQPRVTNLIGRTINSVLGQEAKGRRDPKLEADDDAHQDLADVFSVQLKEAQRETCADMAISGGYSSQVRAGVGWVEVSRVSDPFEYPYRVQDVHRNEIWWDWRAKKIDLSDARWLCRRRWIDLDEAEAQFPEYAAVLRMALDNWASVMTDDWRDDEHQQTAFSSDRSFAIPRNEWMDGARKRIKFYEVWYRMPAVVVCMKIGKKVIQYDQKNPNHVLAVARGLVKLEKRVTSVVRMALYAGPYRLIDVATPKRRFPYIPFFAFRNDSDNTPYGLVQGMVDPQDDYNERRLRIQWMMKAQQLLIDDDALATEYNSIEDVVENMMRPDMVAVLNANRKNVNGVTFRNDLQLQKEQFDVMQDAKGLIQDVPGVYSTQLGNAPAGVTSGLAINSLIEQGMVAMGELNDNYVYARGKVYEALLDLIAEDFQMPNMPVAIGTGQTRRTVILNSVQPRADENGQPIIKPDGQPAMEPVNVVKDMELHCGLSEAPSSPAYMMQMSQMLGQLIGSLAGTPQAAILIPAWVETNSAFGPGRKQLADDMRRITGLPIGGDRQGQEQWQQQQKVAQGQQQQAALEQTNAATQAANADAQHNQAKSELDLANADLARAKAQRESLATATDFHASIQPNAEQGTPARPQDTANSAANDEDARIAAVLQRAMG